MEFDLLSNIQRLALQFPIFLMALIFHEFAHGYSALYFGDSTAKDSGRLTLNPVPHIDPFWTIGLPVFLHLMNAPVAIGSAIPVPINPSRFKNYRKGLFWVSFAGPLMNFFLAQVLALLLMLAYRFGDLSNYTWMITAKILAMGIFLNYGLGFFNLIPIPPLDGSKMVESFLNYEMTRKYESIAPYGFFILMGLFWFGAMNLLMYPIFISASVTCWLFGLDFQFQVIPLLMGS